MAVIGASLVTEAKKKQNKTPKKANMAKNK